MLTIEANGGRITVRPMRTGWDKNDYIMKENAMLIAISKTDNTRIQNVSMRFVSAYAKAACFSTVDGIGFEFNDADLIANFDEWMALDFDLLESWMKALETVNTTKGTNDPDLRPADALTEDEKKVSQTSVVNGVSQ